MGYSILLLAISICLTPAFGSNNTLLENLFPSVSRTHAMPFSATPVVQTDVSDTSLEFLSNSRSQEGLVAKVNSVLSMAKRTEGAKYYAIRRAGEIFEKDELKIGLYYTPSECGLTLYDKTDIIYFLVNASPEEVEIHVNSLLAQCGKLSNHENELRSLWGRPYDPDNMQLDYPQFLDDLRDEMLSDPKPARRHSEPNRRVSFSFFAAPDALQRATSDQYSYIDFVKRRFSYGQGNKESHPPK
jgi:hypothetical protein